MSASLPQFTYLGQTVILRPGKRFTKDELNSRLHQMNVQYDQSSLSKAYFIDLYENALKYDVNKVKFLIDYSKIQLFIMIFKIEK